jgi:ubiquinone biosynthesis protein
VLDLQRAVLLIWLILRYGTGPAVRGLLRLPPRGPSVGERLRISLERLGITYLKLGQYLALRHDILPPDVVQELARLFENVPPMPFDVVRSVVEAELGGPLERFFPTFSRDSIAAASIAQVHEARTTDDTRVAVKVQRVGLDRILAADLRNLRRLGWLIDALHLLGRLSAIQIVNEFGTWTFQEINFLNEGRTAERVRANATTEIVPRVSWSLTTRRILTTEFIDGISLAQIEKELGADPAGFFRRYPDLDLAAVFSDLAYAFFSQLFVSGVFHGDPHPGNILIRHDSRVALVDFGIFGSMTKDERDNATGLVENVVVGNVNAGFRYYARQLTPTEDTDYRQFAHEAKEVLRRWYVDVSRSEPEEPDAAVNGSNGQSPHIGKYIADMIGVSRRNGLQMGMRYLLFWRTLNSLDAATLRFPEYFDLAADLRQFFLTTRPDPRERMRALVSDSDTWTALGDLVTTGAARGPELPSRLVREELELAVRELESPVTQRRRSRDVSILVAAILAVVLALMINVAVR